MMLASLCLRCLWNNDLIRYHCWIVSGLLQKQICKWQLARVKIVAFHKPFL